MDKKDFIESIKLANENRGFSSEIESSLKIYKGLKMQFDLSFVSSTKTFGSQHGSNYEGGYSVTCKDLDSDFEIVVLFEASDNQKIESLSVGGKINEEIEYIGYDNLYQKPIMGHSLPLSTHHEKNEEPENENSNQEQITPSLSIPVETIINDDNQQKEGVFNRDKNQDTAEQAISQPAQYKKAVHQAPLPKIDPISLGVQTRSDRGGGKGKPFLLLLVIVLLCGGVFVIFKNSFSDSTKVSIEKIDDGVSGRGFTGIYSINGIDLIEAKLEYLGKDPNLPFIGKGPTFNWKARSTDFYSSSMKNLSNYTIYIRSLKYKLKKGNFSGINPRTESYLKSYWTSTKILPGETVYRKNNWVWGKAKTNTLTKTYSLEIEPIKSDPSQGVDPIFTSNDVGPVGFKIAYPLKFIR